MSIAPAVGLVVGALAVPQSHLLLPNRGTPELENHLSHSKERTGAFSNRGKMRVSFTLSGAEGRQTVFCARRPWPHRIRGIIPPVPAGFAPIPGLKIGHVTDTAALTGCTVLLCERGMVAACDVRGGAVGERELQTLRPGHIVERIHALVLAGGSAFGLDAASGVMCWCEERGIGFDTGPARPGETKERLKVPIVPAAILFDLRLGDPKRRPDAAMGYAAAQAAAESPVAEGNVGAGTGATVGKLFGIACATKAGIGCWTEEITAAKGKCRVAALAAVNAFGDIRDPDSGRILAGARRAKDSREFADTAAAMRAGKVRAGFADPNTVLVAIATDAALTRLEAQRLAVMASAGVASVVSPAHTMFDGDIVFALSVGEARADVNALGAAAAEAAARAILRGVTEARSAGGVPAMRDL